MTVSHKQAALVQLLDGLVDQVLSGQVDSLVVVHCGANGVGLNVNWTGEGVYGAVGMLQSGLTITIQQLLGTARPRENS